MEDFREGGDLAEGDQEFRFGIAENGGLAEGVFLNAVGAKRRVHGHGNAAGEPDTSEAEEKFGPGGKHESDSVAGVEAALSEFGSDAFGAGEKFAAGDNARGVVVDVEGDVGGGGLLASALDEDFGESLGGGDVAGGGFSRGLGRRFGDGGFGLGFL